VAEGGDVEVVLPSFVEVGVGESGLLGDGVVMMVLSCAAGTFVSPTVVAAAAMYA
jgi:hypothetical protein